MLVKLEAMSEADDMSSHRPTADLPLRMKVAIKKQMRQAARKKASIASASEAEQMLKVQKIPTGRQFSGAKQPLQNQKKIGEREELDDVLGVRSSGNILTTKVSIFRKLEEEIELGDVNRVVCSHPASALCCLAQPGVRPRGIQRLGHQDFEAQERSPPIRQGKEVPR